MKVRANRNLNSLKNLPKVETLIDIKNLRKFKMALKIQINIENPGAFENNYRGDILRIPAPKFGCPLSQRYAETEQAWLECYEKSKHDLVKRVERP